MRLSNKKILLGITGGIAAYKAVLLLRLLRREGAEVQVIITPGTTEFIGVATLAALSGKPVLSAISEPGTGTWNNHVELGLNADLLIVAPLTANTLSKFAHGVCDNLLTAVYLSRRCPALLAPAMDFDMWEHPATQANVQTVLDHGCDIAFPEEGELASGLSGPGRMMEPEGILELAIRLSGTQELMGQSVLITAGPTHEAIDPVRFIGNRSSGKMGYALAAEFAALGAEVNLISGPVALDCPPGVNRISVENAAEMHQACMQYWPKADIAVMAAAVADFTPLQTSELKIKKQDGLGSIELLPTADILAAMGKSKKKEQILVGFALETDNEAANAKKKLEAKNCDFLVLNSLRDAGAGFGHDTNRVSIFGRSGMVLETDLKSKTEIASIIAKTVCGLE